MQPDFDADDLQAAGAAAPGPPASRRKGQAQLWVKGPSDGPICQGSKAGYQVRRGGPTAQSDVCSSSDLLHATAHWVLCSISPRSF
jgi:hypothetical protein